MKLIANNDAGPAMTPEITALNEKIIGCAIEVHRQLGPGLLESAYERAMCVELEDAEIRFECEMLMPVEYKGRLINFNSRLLKDGVKRYVL